MSSKSERHKCSSENRRSGFLADAPLECLYPGPGWPQLLRAEEPDRDARAFLRMVNLAPRSAGAAISLHGLRQSARLSSMALGSRPAVASVQDHVMLGPDGPMTLRVFTPDISGEPLPALLWYFGGGFVVGDLDTAESICRHIALTARCITVAVRYRLAPEHDIAASREDAMAALQWVSDHGNTLGIDTTRLAVGGDSAGGNLAAAVAQQARRDSGPALKAQVLVYPATDLIGRFPSYEQNIHGGYLLTADAVSTLESYLTRSIETLDLTDPWFSPRRCSDLRDLPPALVVSAGFDPIRDDGLDYAARLRAAGVPVQSLHYPGQFHGFLNFDAVLGASRDALERIGRVLAERFQNKPAQDCTIEVSDIGETRHWPLARTVGEVASYTLTAWTATEGWTAMLLRLLPWPPVRACSRLVAPLLSPVGQARRAMSKRLTPLSAVQTYPSPPADC